MTYLPGTMRILGALEVREEWRFKVKHVADAGNVGNAERNGRCG